MKINYQVIPNFKIGDLVTIKSKSITTRAGGLNFKNNEEQIEKMRRDNNGLPYFKITKIRDRITIVTKEYLDPNQRVYVIMNNYFLKQDLELYEGPDS